MGHLPAAVTYYSNPSSTNWGAILLFLLFGLVFYVVATLGAYGTYKKAGSYGEPAWAAFVPIYNFIILLRIAGRPKTWAWFLLLLLPIPILNFFTGIAFLVISIFVLNDVSKSFGHGGGFTVGLVLLSVVFWWILWLGSSTYRGPAGPAAAGGGTFGGPAGGGYAPQPGYPPPGYPPAGQAPPPPPPMPTYPPTQPPPPPGQMPPPQ